MKKILTIFLSLAPLLCSAASIDALVAAKLHEEGIAPSRRVSDERLARRFYLVTTDRIPTAVQAKAYIDNPDPQALVDSLLASEGFVESMVLKWGDLLRIKSEFPSNHWPNAVQAYNKWLTDRFRANRPYDVFVRELLSGTGSNFRSPQTNFWRTGAGRSPSAHAENIALLFLGTRSAPSQWAPFFGQIKFKSTGEWKEEIMYLDIDVRPPFGPITMPDGNQITLHEDADYREPFVRWLTSSENRQFARAMANRMWFWFMGRGIVEPCDDFSQENVPSNAPLLEYLTDRFIASGFDMRALAREILLSDAFATSSISTAENRGDSAFFSHYPLRRLTAEQIIDAICDITKIPDMYSSRAPEPFTNYPLGTRATQIGDGTVTTAQLEIFGRPSRDLALESNRDNSLNSKQIIYLLNSTDLYDKLRRSPYLEALMKSTPTLKGMATHIYLTVLGRYPTQPEIEAFAQWAGESKDRKQLRASAESLIWALLNTDEFIFVN